MYNKFVFSIALLGGLFFILVSCKKQEDKGIPPVSITHVKGVAGYGEAIFTWDPVSNTPADSASFLYTSISYADSTGKVYEQKYSRYTDSVAITGLSNRPYTFIIKTVGTKGAFTDVTSITLTPNQPVYVIIAKTLLIEPSIGGARVSWINNTGKTVVVNASWKDASGTTQSQSFTSSKVNGVGYVSGLAGGAPVVVSATVADISQIRSAPVTATITPQVEVRLSRTGWSVAGFSDQEAGGEGPVNGYATAAIDGNTGTFWHTAWNESQPPYPHWIAINIGQAATISRFGLVNRQNNSGGQTEIQLMGSMDKTNWTDLGTFPFQQKNPEQFFSVSPQKWQYLKVVLTKGPNFFGFLAEINLYGAQ
ncbi:discoidin domain-containing protein [Chitinophaga sp. 22321]|uniref:Discoidin domain-containing protein n=1 Tax=Chitinophaga hostae TaxID=2831022 RepID=A0ABS5J541_9BACT|nr:discoidin domain-containing protein [Chitinophaga hostae]MBS0030338.1 discoidin domain-containing protein [Chitinophaga hostae]